MSAKARLHNWERWRFGGFVFAIVVLLLLGGLRLTAPPLDLAQARTLAGHVPSSAARGMGKNEEPHVEFRLQGESLWLLAGGRERTEWLHAELVQRDVEAKVLAERRGLITRQSVVELRRDGELLHSFQDTLAIRAAERTQGWIFLAMAGLALVVVGGSTWRNRREARANQETYLELEAELGSEVAAQLRAKAESIEEGLCRLAELDRLLHEQRLAHGGVALCCVLFGLPALLGGGVLMAKLDPEPMLGGGVALALGLGACYGGYLSWAGRHNAALTQEREALRPRLEAEVKALEAARSRSAGELLAPTSTAQATSPGRV